MVDRLIVDAPQVVVEASSLKHCIYPAYLDSTKSIPQGRRMAKALCVPEPTIEELVAICKQLRIPYVAEDKAYPRDWLTRGRLRVNETADLSTKPALMKKICQALAETRSRTALSKPVPSSSSQPSKKKK